MGPSRTLCCILGIAVVGGCPSGAPQSERRHHDQVASSPERSSAPRSPAAGPPSRAGESRFPAQVAGSAGRGFYESNAQLLQREIDQYVAREQPHPELQHRDLLGLIAPHAGYRYSGPTAAAAYRQLQGRQYRTVVLLALSHRQRNDKVAVLDVDAYETPLGPVPVDRPTIRQLLAAGGGEGGFLESSPSLFEGEHSLEVQLPFLQRTLDPGFSVVPLLLATGNEEDSQRLADLLYQQLGRRQDVLFVASSDLSHFFPADEAARLDRAALELVTGLRVDAFRARGPAAREMPCGSFPLLTLMELVQRYDSGVRRATLLKYQNSGDTAGDRSRVVGYGAVAFSLDQGQRTEQARPESPPPAAETTSSPVSQSDRATLLELARQAVAAAVDGRSVVPTRPSSPALTAPGAAFVTLRCGRDEAGRCVRRGEDLRGCIGHVVAQVPLYQCVSEVARSAAIEDRRFRPLTRQELSFVGFELSVLTPPELVRDPQTVVVGRDGLVMSQGLSRGLLLPQVPVEWGWNREQFLQQTCHKARLDSNCWQDPRTRIERFGAIVWREDLALRER